MQSQWHVLVESVLPQRAVFCFHVVLTRKGNLRRHSFGFRSEFRSLGLSGSSLGDLMRTGLLELSLCAGHIPAFLQFILSDAALIYVVPAF